MSTVLSALIQVVLVAINIYVFILIASAVMSWLLAFNVLNSTGYALVAFARAGPFERDTRGMAESIGVDERAIGALVLAPAVFDTIRYFKPEARWAIWASRAAKVGSVLLVIKRP